MGPPQAPAAFAPAPSPVPHGPVPVRYGAGPLPAPMPPIRAPRPPRRWPYALGAGVAAATLGGILGYYVFTHLGQPDVLDPRVVADEALTIVHEDFGLSDATDMACPADQPVEDGHAFVCTFMQGTHTSSVQIVVRGEDGTYEVGADPAQP